MTAVASPHCGMPERFSPARQELNVIGHRLQQRVFVEILGDAALSRNLDEPIEIGRFVALALGEDRVLPRKGEDMALIADCNSHRIALCLPFEAYMSGDVFPSS